MKRILLSLITPLLLAACQKSPTEVPTTSDPGKPKDTAGDAVQLKEGHGLALHAKLRESIHLKIVEVSEERVDAEVSMQLHVIQGAEGVRPVSLTPGTGTEASGWIPAAKAALIKPGQNVDLRVNATSGGNLERGIVKRVENAPGMPGQYEVVVRTEALFDTGTRLNAMIHAPADKDVTTVPRSALLKTAEGWFVYATNENFYLRTAVKVGAMNGQLAEITDGLYPGDQIIASPVNTLWMAELQILRGGKSCTCGH